MALSVSAPVPPSWSALRETEKRKKTARRRCKLEASLPGFDLPGKVCFLCFAPKRTTNKTVTQLTCDMSTRWMFRHVSTFSLNSHPGKRGASYPNNGTVADLKIEYYPKTNGLGPNFPTPQIEYFRRKKKRSRT